MPFALLALALAQDRVPSITGTVEKFVHASQALGNTRNVLVYLPPGYENDKRRRYPVLYLHDGQNVFDGATSYIPNQEWRCDEAAEALIGAGVIEPLIMVAIDNAGVARADEYLWKRIKFRDTEFGGRADLYLKMVAEEIKPLIDEKYRTKRGAADTGLCGSSFGGVVTYHMGFTRPDVFRRLAIVSPSVWIDDRAMIREVDQRKDKLPLKIWLDMGGAEGPDALRDARGFRDALLKKGWQAGKDLLYYEEARAEHNEAAWARRFPSILTFLFRK